MKITLQKLLPYPIKELDHSDSDIWAKDEVNFETNKTYLLRAFSGKGKTTLLSAIYGIRRDYEGDIQLNSINIKTFSNNRFAEIRKNHISYVFQGLDLFDELTVFENIAIKNKLTKHKTAEEIDILLNQLDIISLKFRLVKTLSFGQKQRVAIVRALCQPFAWIFLDEPFSHLDNINIQKAYSLMNEECKMKNAGLILTSLSNNHDIKFDFQYRI